MANTACVRFVGVVGEPYKPKASEVMCFGGAVHRAMSVCLGKAVPDCQIRKRYSIQAVMAQDLIIADPAR